MADPSPSLDELTTPISRQEFEESMIRVMAAIGLKTSSWKPGAVVRAMIVAVSVMLYGLSVIIASVNRLGFLELSSGAWLRICAYFGFGTAYNAATFAAGTLVISNTGALVFDEPAGEMRFLGGDGQEYVATQRVQVAAFQTGVLVGARAVVAGEIGGNAPAGTITRFGAAYSGLVVTNPAAFVGTDDETDAALLVRARTSAAAISPNGPSDAYERVALDATRADGTTLAVNRVRVVRGPGDRSCTVYAATATGAIAGDANDEGTDLGRLQYLLRTRACPTGMTAYAASGIGLTVNVVYEVWLYTTSGLSASQAQSAILSAVSSYIKAMKIGGDRKTSGATGYVYLNKLRDVIIAALPEGATFDCELSTPTSNLACEGYSVPQVGSVSGMVNLVSP
jgi:hypothetical protein